MEIGVEKVGAVSEYVAAESGELRDWPTVADLPPKARRATARELLNNSGSFVYFLVRGDECIYVGQTTRMFSRTVWHSWRKDFDDVYVMRVAEVKRREVEKHWIATLRPRFNRPMGGARAGAGRPRADDPTIVMANRIPSRLAAKLDAYAKRHGLTRSAAVTEAIRRLVTASGYR